MPSLVYVKWNVKKWNYNQPRRGYGIPRILGNMYQGKLIECDLTMLRNPLQRHVRHILYGHTGKKL